MSSFASVDQIRHLLFLVQTREFYPDLPEILTETQASTLIDMGKTAPFRQRSVAPVGLYLFEGDVYKVVESKDSPGRYAVKLVIEGLGFRTGRWDHTRGVVLELTPEHRLRMEEARVLGRRFEVCVCCGYRLAKQEDKSAGVHLRCADRFV